MHSSEGHTTPFKGYGDGIRRRLPRGLFLLFNLHPHYSEFYLMDAHPNTLRYFNLL